MILFNVLAKGIILLGFFLAGPYLLREYALTYTDDRLEDKKVKVLAIIQQEGIESFFQGDEDSGYGSYNLLKDEYISLEKITEVDPLDTIFNEERIIEEDVVSYRVLAYRFGEGEEMFLLEIGRSLAMIQQVERGMSTFIKIAFVVFILLSVILDGTYHTFLLRPFHTIIYDKLPAIKEPHQYAFQPIETSTVDFKILDETISNMMTRIQQVFNREREFISHASHELRTPISVLQSKIENRLSEGVQDDKEEKRLMDMLEIIHRFKHLVNSLLLISKISNAQYVKDEQVDLRIILNELAEEWEPVAREKGLHFLVNVDPSVIVAQASHSMVLMMIQNALINAIRYTSPSGTIKLSSYKGNESAIVEVSDTGSGISHELLNQVKDGNVFLKDAKSEKSGFGLQIMHKIATFLNVRLTIDSGSEGTTIRFIFEGPSFISKDR